MQYFLVQIKGKVSCIIDQCFKDHMEHKGIDYNQTFEENGTRLSICKVGNVWLENELEKIHFLSFKPFVFGSKLSYMQRIRVWQVFWEISYARRKQKYPNFTPQLSLSLTWPIRGKIPIAYPLILFKLNSYCRHS